MSVDAVRVGAVGWRGPQGHDVSSVAAAERPFREATRGAPQWGRFRGDGADLENIVDDKSSPERGGGDVREPPALGLDCAIVFGLAFAASLYSYRQMEAARGEWGHAITGQTFGNGLLTPSLDAVAAVQQWIFTRRNEA